MKSNSVTPLIDRVGDFTETKFGISSSEDLVYIFDILRNKLYSDKIKAVIREYSTNAADANVENGIPDRPIKIVAPTVLSPQFSVRDFGRGLSEDAIRQVYCMYGKSTKRDSNAYTGQLGLGSKSGFSYSDSFCIVSYHKGVKTSYLAYIDESKLGSIAKTSEEASNEEDGMEIIIPVKSSDIRHFESKIIECVEYFKVTPNCVNITLPSDDSEPFFLQGEDWKVSNQYASNATIVMGNIGYPIQSSFFEVDYSTRKSLSKKDADFQDFMSRVVKGSYLKPVINVDIGEVCISANREELEYNDQTVAAIKKKLYKVYCEISAKCSAQLNSCENILDAHSMVAFLSKFSAIVPEGLKWRNIDIHNSQYKIDDKIASVHSGHVTKDKVKIQIEGNGVIECRANSQNSQKFEHQNNLGGVYVGSIIDKTYNIFIDDGKVGNISKFRNHVKNGNTVRSNSHFYLIKFVDNNSSLKKDMESWGVKNCSDLQLPIREPRQASGKQKSSCTIYKHREKGYYHSDKYNWEEVSVDKNIPQVFIPITRFRCSYNDRSDIIEIRQLMLDMFPSMAKFDIYGIKERETQGFMKAGWTSLKDLFEKYAKTIDTSLIQNDSCIYEAFRCIEGKKGGYYGNVWNDLLGANLIRKLSLIEEKGSPMFIHHYNFYNKYKKQIEGIIAHKPCHNERSSKYNEYSRLCRFFGTPQEPTTSSDSFVENLKKETEQIKEKLPIIEICYQEFELKETTSKIKENIVKCICLAHS